MSCGLQSRTHFPYIDKLEIFSFLVKLVVICDGDLQPQARAQILLGEVLACEMAASGFSAGESVDQALARLQAPAQKTSGDADVMDFDETVSSAPPVISEDEIRT